MYHSHACWQSEEDGERQYAKLTSNTTRVSAVKEKIRMTKIGFGWNDVHIAWSKNGRDFKREELRDQFIDIVLSIEGNMDIPPDPKVDLPSRGERTKLGTRSNDLDLLENEREAKKYDSKKTSAKLIESIEMDGQTDRYEKIQTDRPEVDEEITGVRIEQWCEFNELYGNKVTSGAS